MMTHLKASETDSTSTATGEAVRDLFNAKASNWTKKYGTQGPLSARLTAFECSLAQRMDPPAKVLDLGCGTGNLAAHLAARGYQVTGCDIAEEMLMEAQSAYSDLVEWVQLPVNWTRLPFEDGAFDALVASSVLEYVADLPDVLRELARMLQPGGVLLFTAPNVANRVRRVEAVVQPFARALRRITLPAPLARFDRYLAYLRMSKNRMPLCRWTDLLHEVGLAPIQDRFPDESREFSGPRASLALLAFERSVGALECEQLKDDV
jgi:2-polyprenyl-3-methyl-5-hydroxy-6-metoxy-1,4-benzoquinol methylase